MVRNTSSLVIDSICDQARNEDITVACLYCDFLAQQEQTITSMMGAILKQLIGKGDIPIYLREAFQQGKQEIGGRALLFADLMRMLKMTIASLPQVFICIDALDEFLPKDVPVLLESLRDIVRESPSTRIFLTGRPHVKEDIQRYFPRVVLIPINPKTGDIRNYLEMRLERDAEPEAMSDGLRADIIRIMIERTSNMCVRTFSVPSLSLMYAYQRLCRFLLVALNIDAVLGEVTIRQRRKKLQEMVEGNGLSDAYTATLTRVKGQKGNKSVLGVKVLMWVSYSERPLRAQELCHALGVEIGSSDLDLENIPALRTLIASCLGLVTIEESSSTVRLVHFTLQEHLLSNPTLFHNPHSTISEICLTYLNYGSVCDLSPILYSAPLTMPLLEYASYYWGKHARMGMTENSKTLALRLLDRFDEHISAQLLLLRYKNERSPFNPYFNGAERLMRFTGLHGASFLGIVEIVASVLEMKEWDLNQSDCMGCTALAWAAIRGYEGVVKILLEREDINPNQADTGYGRTPLSWAAKNGHEGVVRILLEREDINPDQADNYGQTPLLWAAKEGHEGVVRMLLEREDINPDQADTFLDQMPLLWAAEKGHEGVVRILLERGDVNLNQTDIKYGRTPLLWATKEGHEGVVKILLERGDVNPNQADRRGLTPLWWAALSKHEGTVRMLLEREDINPNQADTEYGRTPLSWAAGHGHVSVVKILLERQDVSTTALDHEGQTPLSLALSRGYDEVVKILRDSSNSRTTHLGV